MFTTSTALSFFPEATKFTDLQITPVIFFGQRELLVPDLFQVIGKKRYNNFFDPFSGSGSISFAAMHNQLAATYHINDSDPVFKAIWNMIKDSPKLYIDTYTHLVETYCAATISDRKELYSKWLIDFNLIKSSGNFSKAEAIFTFLINFASKNIPVFDNQFNLTTEPNCNIEPSEEINKLSNFKARTHYLSRLFNANPTSFYSGNFQACIETAVKGDVVILDPPYPTQAQSVYYKIKSEQELQQNIRATLLSLDQKDIDFLILYGAVRVSLNNQFDEDTYNVHHLVRLSTSKIYGDGLEHIYVSRKVNLTADRLPSHMAFYHDYFEKGVEMSEQAYQAAVTELQAKRDGNTLDYKAYGNLKR